jgi:hypothetical protein
VICSRLVAQIHAKRYGQAYRDFLGVKGALCRPLVQPVSCFRLTNEAFIAVVALCS